MQNRSSEQNERETIMGGQLKIGCILLVSERSERHTIHWCRFQILGYLLSSERSTRDTIKGRQLKIEYMFDVYYTSGVLEHKGLARLKLHYC